MSVFLVALNEPDVETWERLKDRWPGRHFIVTDRMAFLAPEGITVTQEIADALGMNAEHQVLGLVIELGNYAGRGPASVVEWISKVE